MDEEIAGQLGLSCVDDDDDEEDEQGERKNGLASEQSSMLHGSLQPMHRAGRPVRGHRRTLHSDPSHCTAVAVGGGVVRVSSRFPNSEVLLHTCDRAGSSGALTTTANCV